MKFEQIREVIERADSVVIYRHINPDYDAIGSQLGLKHLIMDNYPDKKVYAYGKETIDNDRFVEKMDDVSEETIRQSLTVILDCSTVNRADDQSFLKGKEILKIDHHLRSEHVSENEYVDSDASSVCLIITQMAMQLGLKVSKEAAQFLFAGILTDSCRLSIDKVDGNTFRYCGFLIDCGADVPFVNRQVFDSDINGFKAGLHFENKIAFDKDVAYFFGDLNDEKTYGLDSGLVKDYVDTMANIKGVNKYAVFAQLPNENWTVSLRSHQKSVVEISREYGGGGHALACGIPEVTYDQCLEIIEKLKNVKE